nr:hypothetical protein Iba_chr04dCG18940 [Ipomoea batatas]
MGPLKYNPAQSSNGDFVLFTLGQKFFIIEPNKKLGQRFKKQRRLIHVSRVHDVRQHAPPQAIGVHEDIDELLHLRRHGLLDGRFRLLTRPFAAPPLPPNPINKLRLSVPGTRRQRGHHEPEPALDLVDPRRERPRRAPPRHIQVPRLTEILPRFSSGVFVGIVVLEKRAEEIGEEVGMEVSEPEERLLEAVAPVREERLSDCSIARQCWNLLGGINYSIGQDFSRMVGASLQVFAGRFGMRGMRRSRRLEPVGHPCFRVGGAQVFL